MDIFAQRIADFLRYPHHPEYVRWFALILAFDCLAELPFARLRLEQRLLESRSLVERRDGLQVVTIQRQRQARLAPPP